jgi:hypothetical protein
VLSLLKLGQGHSSYRWEEKVERAEKVLAVVGSLVWTAADLSSLSDCLYAQLRQREREREETMFKDYILNRHKSQKGIQTH